jgi:hypothetical protein
MRGQVNIFQRKLVFHTPLKRLVFIKSYPFVGLSNYLYFHSAYSPLAALN